MKRGQIWVETVIYTLIAFAMIGLVLGFVKPKIEEMQDKAIIDQSLEMIKAIDRTIIEIGIPGNKRQIELGIKKGDLKIDGENDKIIFEIETKNEYSEPKRSITDPASGIMIKTEKIGRLNKVSLTKDYTGDYDVTVQGENVLKTLTKASIPYKIFISNKGGEPGVIDIEIS